MTHRIRPDGDDRPGRADSAPAWDDDAPLDHHIEELLGALSDLEPPRPGGGRELRV